MHIKEEVKHKESCGVQHERTSEESVHPDQGRFSGLAQIQEPIRVVDGIKLLTQNQTLDFIGIKSRSRLHLIRKEDDSFPKPIKFTSRNLFWRLDQLQDWMSSKVHSGSEEKD